MGDEYSNFDSMKCGITSFLNKMHVVCCVCSTHEPEQWIEQQRKKTDTHKYKYTGPIIDKGYNHIHRMRNSTRPIRILGPHKEQIHEEKKTDFGTTKTELLRKTNVRPNTAQRSTAAQSVSTIYLTSNEYSMHWCFN